jgi:cytosine permease
VELPDSAPSSSPPADPSLLPPTLRFALSAPPLERKSWVWGVGPHTIGLFLWVVYFDRLAPTTLGVGGLAWSALGALVGGLLCFLLLYQGPALWGQRTGRGLTVLGSSTFGTSGSVWITDVLIGLAEVVWFAVATYYATHLILQAFVSFHMLDPRALRPIAYGRWTFQSPLFLVTSLVWSLWAALVGHYLVRIIAALMNVFPIFPALMLGLAMLLTLKGVASYTPPALDPAAAGAVEGAVLNRAGLTAFLTMIQIVFGFYAMAGVMSADWGAATRTSRDVTVGGLVSVAFASATVATLALLTVAGAAGQLPDPASATLTFHESVEQAIGGTLAGTMLLIFGLASLAPTTYAAFVFSHRFAAVWPRVSGLSRTLIGMALAWPLIAIGWAGRLEAIFGLMGAIFAPVAGAIAADASRSRGVWPGPRPGTSTAGLGAWAAGLGVGLVPTIAASWRIEPMTRLQPASLFAFLTAYIVFRVLASLGFEPPAAPIPAEEPVNVPTP